MTDLKIIEKMENARVVNVDELNIQSNLTNRIFIIHRTTSHSSCVSDSIEIVIEDECEPNTRKCCLKNNKNVWNLIKRCHGFGKCIVVVRNIHDRKEINDTIFHNHLMYTHRWNDSDRYLNKLIERDF